MGSGLPHLLSDKTSLDKIGGWYRDGKYSRQFHTLLKKYLNAEFFESLFLASELNAVIYQN